MGSKTISLRDKAYRKLKRRKRKGESFSDVVLRLTEKDPNDFSDLKGEEIDVSWQKIRAERNR